MLRCAMRKAVRFLTTAFLLGIATTGVAQTTPTLKKVTKFDLPGPGGKRFDYLTIDEDDHYLLSAHLAAGQTYVIDLGTNKVIATITDTPGAGEWNTSRNSRSSIPQTLTTTRSVLWTSSR